MSYHLSHLQVILFDPSYEKFNLQLTLSSQSWFAMNNRLHTDLAASFELDRCFCDMVHTRTGSAGQTSVIDDLFDELYKNVLKSIFTESLSGDLSDLKICCLTHRNWFVNRLVAN